MELQKIISIVTQGDLEGLAALTAAGETEGFSPEEKCEITRAAARAGQAAVLRALFERFHLYGVEEDAEGRTLLHYAARSGDAATVFFCLSTLGYDPLAGDTAGKTALEEALEARRPEAYQALRDHLGFGPEACYRNPVLRGCHPDPSVVRRGDDFYLVNSSFTLFPGLPVYHSRDLVRWEEIGHAVENLETSGLVGLPGGFGYWAPDISWHQGRFWVIATLRRPTPPYRLQMLTSAADPRGPWSAPVFLPLDGIDPSLFTDEDGRRYVLLNPGAALTEIDSEGHLLGEPELISFGCARIKPEGPHLLRKDGWYYLFLAEGGTGFEHMETVLRSRQLRGPYESCPFNPILGRKRANSPIQRSGHGKPVQLADGRWMMVYLCGRPVEGNCLMGRETALDPIIWTADGWPMVNRLKGPSCLQLRPLPPWQPETAAGEEAWVSPRSDPADFAAFAGNTLYLRCGADPADPVPCGVILRRQREARFTQEARLDLAQVGGGTLAGLTGYYDEHSFYLFGLRKEETGSSLILTEQVGGRRQTQKIAGLPGQAAILRAEGDGLSRRLTAEDDSGRTWSVSLRTDYLCDEGLRGGKRFTGAMLGLAAVGEGTAVFTGLCLRFMSPPEQG